MSVLVRKYPILYLIIAILGTLLLIFAGCAQPQKQALTATPLEVPKEGSPGEYINVIIQVASNKPCRLVLATPHKTEIDNYLAPYSIDTLTIPNSDGEVVFHERIPAHTMPGNYVLKVIQMKRVGDTNGTEIFSQTFVIR